MKKNNNGVFENFRCMFEDLCKEMSNEASSESKGLEEEVQHTVDVVNEEVHYTLKVITGETQHNVNVVQEETQGFTEGLKTVVESVVASVEELGRNICSQILGSSQGGSELAEDRRSPGATSASLPREPRQAQRAYNKVKRDQIAAKYAVPFARR